VGQIEPELTAENAECAERIVRIGDRGKQPNKEKETTAASPARGRARRIDGEFYDRLVFNGF
jgi:hypothetical protein